MTRLQQRALARLSLTVEEVERIYGYLRFFIDNPDLRNTLAELCESHERLRAELEGATILLKEREEKA